MNRAFDDEAGRLPPALSFVYQRYSLNNFSGARLAAARRVPFVVEYNGSEIWMSRHWGSPLEYEALCGAVIRAARRHQIVTPHMDTVYALMKLLDAISRLVPATLVAGDSPGTGNRTKGEC